MAVVTPAAALATVALGLRLGASNAVRAAVVYAAPRSDAGTGLAWQVQTFEEERGGREPVSVSDVLVVGRVDADEVRWRGGTNEDGVAEVLLPLPSADQVHLDVTSAATTLASGEAATRATVARARPGSSWARFARREGPIALDVAVLGQRVASGFPATIWVRATDSASHTPLVGILIEPEPDASFAPATTTARTDARGWAEVVATPIGHAVTMTLHARAADGRRGLWMGAMFVSPGAAQLRARARYSPDDEPQVDIVVPTVRQTEYLEVDDAAGRVWATIAKLDAEGGGTPHASVHAPRLSPGLYWAVTSSDPAGAATLGPGTSARPFTVAATDAAALAFGSDASECAPPLDPREVPRVLSMCLALAAAAPVPRWTALEGFSDRHAGDERRRARGVRLALAAIAVAAALETLLLLRAAAAARAGLRAVAGPDEDGDERVVVRALVGRAWTVGIAILVAVLGFVLLAAFVGRLR
jgi:hypothetical protein